MSKLLRWSVGALAMALVVGICGQTKASITSVTTIPATVGSLSWIGSPDYVSGTNADIASGLGTGQGLPTPTGLGNHTSLLAELITPQTGSTYGVPNNHGFTISTVGVFASGGNTGIVNTMHLYDVTSTITGGLNAAGNVTTYTITGLTDMLGGGAGDSFSWNPGALSYTVFTLDDAPVLQLDHTYALEIWSDQSQAGGSNNDFVWSRFASTSPTDPGGMMMASGNASSATARTTISAAGLAGGSPRTAGIALNVAVPEPATIVLFGLAVPALACAARRRKS